MRVLCVDDNKDVADTEVMLLQVAGFEALACYDGPSALVAAKDFRPGVCLLDLNMPGMDGDELAVRLRRAHGWHPPALVAVTALDDEGSRARTEAAGFVSHVVKPVEPRQLLSVIQDLCEPDDEVEAE